MIYNLIALLKYSIASFNTGPLKKYPLTFNYVDMPLLLFSLNNKFNYASQIDII